MTQRCPKPYRDYAVLAKRAREKPCKICGETINRAKYCELCGPEVTEMKKTWPWKTYSEAEQRAEVLRRVTAMRKRHTGYFELKSFMNYNTTTN